MLNYHINANMLLISLPAAIMIKQLNPPPPPTRLDALSVPLIGKRIKGSKRKAGAHGHFGKFVELRLRAEIKVAEESANAGE